MKQKLLLTLFIPLLTLAVNAQKSSVYAITGSQKGQNNWTEVRLIDITSGEELKTVFKNSDETQPLNARTGKPVVKKEMKPENLLAARITPDGNVTISSDNNGRTIIRVKTDVNTNNTSPSSSPQVEKLREEALQKMITDNKNGASSAGNLQAAKIKEGGNGKFIIENNGQLITITNDGNTNTIVTTNSLAMKEAESKMQQQVIKLKHDVNTVTTTKTLVCVKDLEGKMQTVRTEMLLRMNPSLDKPFSTYSAACAYDKKHERLYYTPMGIAQLRYIDLKAKTPQVYYFEDEQFGALRGRGDISNQITRMVIGADGNGYALTNNADHLVRFTTDKKATFTDLGGLTDAPGNGNFTVHSAGGYGGDIIAAKTGDLFLITANHNIFQIEIKSMTAAYKGTIQGLPRGYSTNGAAVEEGTMVLVNSSNSTQGYYHFDINKLVAEKVNSSTDTYNASDLANANLLAVKKEKKEEEQPQVVAPPVMPERAVEIAPIKNNPTGETVQETRLAVYPNPVTNGVVNLLLDNYTPGKYQAKLIDVSGKQITAKSFTINSKSHTEPFNLSPSIAKGNYLIQIYDQSTKNAGVVKLVVQ